MAEKQRRDNLNTNISTMASLLPTVAGSSRRMDKISILRLAAAFLRTQYTLGHGSTRFLPRKLNEFDLEQYFVDQLIGYGGFFLVVTAAGKIVYVSRQVEQHLGHAQNELLGQSLYNFIHPEDHDELTRNLTPDGMRPTSSTTTTTTTTTMTTMTTTTTPSPTGGQMSDLGSDNNSNDSSDDSTSRRAAETLKLFREQRRSFKIRMSQRTVSRREHTQYEHLNVSGILRLAEACRSTEITGSRGRHREMTSTSNDVVFAGVASLPRSITELSIIDANKDEYVTRHLVDGRIIFCDHRVSIVAGYLSEEVSGRSAFGFMHKDDYKWTMLGLQQMYLRAVTWGSSCYRLLAKSGEFIYLRTHGYLEYDKDAQSFESFVCVNTLVPEAEGIKLIQEMKQRYSAISLSTNKFMIEDSSPLNMDMNSLSPSQCLEEPAELEAAISNLISDVPSLAVSENHFSPSPMPNMQFVKAAIFSSRLPPVAAQANKIGINKIPQHHVFIRDNDKQSLNIKKESNGDKHTCSRKLINSSGMEQNRISDAKIAKISGKPLLMFKTMNSVRNGRHNVHSDDVRVHSNVLTTRESSTNSCLPHNHVLRLDISQSADILDTQERLGQQPDANIENTACNIKIERNIDMFDCLEEQEPVLQYYDSTSSNSSAISPASDSHNRLKRICSDEDLTTVRSKKRSSDVYASSNGNDVRQSVSYVNCRTFVAENTYPAITSEFNRYNNTSTQPLMTTAESPNSSLHLVPPEIGGIDYQQLVGDHSVATSLVITNPDEEQLNNLQNLKDDTLLNSDLDPNPDIMMKIFDDLRLVTGLDKNFDGAKVEQLTSNDQAVNDEIKRTYRQLANNIALRESQFNVLARDLEIPALRAQRENLSQLQVEHNIQKQMLKTLQQDHRNMQINVKHNMGM